MPIDVVKLCVLMARVRRPLLEKVVEQLRVGEWPIELGPAPHDLYIKRGEYHDTAQRYLEAIQEEDELEYDARREVE